MAGARDIRAGKGYIELGIKDKVDRGLRAIKAKLGGLANLAKSAAIGVGAIGAVGVAGLVGAAKRFASVGDELDKMSARTGLTASYLSKLNHAAKLGGTDLKSMETGIRRLQRSALDAQRGLSTQTEAFDRLGVSVTDAKGNLKGTEQLFGETAEALANIKNETERAALAQMVFGRSGTALLPMLRNGKNGLKAAFEEAERLGLVMGGQDAAAAAKLTDAWGRMTKAVDMVLVRVGGALAPMLTDLGNRLAGIAASVGKWINENKAFVMSTEGIAIAWQVAWAKVAVVWEKAKADLLGIWDIFKAAIRKRVVDCHTAIATIMVQGWGAIEGLWINVTSALTRVWARFTASIRGAWENVQNWLVKRMHELHGAIDSTFDAAAAKGLTDQTTKSRMAGIRKGLDSALEASTSKQKGRLTKLQAWQAQMFAGLEQSGETAKGALDKAAAASIVAREGTIHAAEKRLKAVLGKAQAFKAKAAAAADEKAAAAPAAAPNMIGDMGGNIVRMMGLKAQATQAVLAGITPGATVGFGGRAISSIGGGSPAQRIGEEIQRKLEELIRHSKKTADNTEDMTF